MSLYSKHGYTPVDSRPITTVPEWRNDGKNWVLMLSQPETRRRRAIYLDQFSYKRAFGSAFLLHCGRIRPIPSVR